MPASTSTPSSSGTASAIPRTADGRTNTAYGCTANALTNRRCSSLTTADVEQAELLAAHLTRIDKQVAATAALCRYAQVIDALMCLRGVQMTTAFGLSEMPGPGTPAALV